MHDRGNVVLALLLMLLLAASGLALLTQTGLHLKIVAARKEKRLAAAGLEQALLLSLHRYREGLAAADLQAYPDPETDFFNSGTFPDQVDGEFLSRHLFSRYALRSTGSFKATRILDLVRTSQRDGRLAYAGRAGVDLLAGDIPAGEIGLLVARQSEEAPGDFLAVHGVEFSGAILPLVGDLPLRFEAGRLLCETLGLPVQFPDWRRIRERFGLEPSDSPIPPGIYLAQAEGKVAAAFVEGDLEKLEFGAGDGWQSIVFTQGGRSRELRYQPGRGSLTWSEGGEANGSLFAEKIIVHGSVWDIEQKGDMAFLAAARIELLACGRLVVRSGLKGENLAMGDERLPGLLLMTSDRDFFGAGAVNADVIIDTVGSQVVQAQVVAAGALVNNGGQVDLTGTLLAGDIENSGRLRVGGACGEFAFADRVQLPGFKFLKNFRVHFIQEDSDEE